MDIGMVCWAERAIDEYDGPFLGKRRIGQVGSQDYEWITFSQVEEQAILFASGLIALGNQPGQETFIGIFSQNRPEWVIVDVACMYYSMISVPFYNTVDIKACDRIISQTNMETIVCDTLEKAERLRLEHSALRGLKTVIVMDLPIEGLGEQKAMFEAEGLKLMSFDDVVTCGTKNIVDRVLPKPETVCTLIYTSGTTGQ
nr:long-chain-fatty-acid--CoA ligase 5-like [Lytechinus pictus]